MLSVENTRKAINFDLDDHLLRVNYPLKSSYKNAWREIAYFLEDSGFSHTQYSGYVSNCPMSYGDVNRVILHMCKQLLWFQPSLLHCEVTALVEEYSVIEMIEQNMFKNELD